jgi:hypothetical protein
MAIDDLASEQALKQLEMEDLPKSPPLASSFATAAYSVMKALFKGEISEAIGLLEQIHSSAEAERSAYLLECVVMDLKYLDEKVKKLSERQTIDFVEVLFDADRKARQTRAKTRIKRIADIVTASINITPIPSPDETEEMTGLAVELSDQDVPVLKALQEMQQRYERDGGRSMTGLPLAPVPGLSAEIVLSICGKLLSLGLIADPEQRAVSLGLGSYPRGGGYMLLERGQRFLKFIEQAAAAPQT